MKLIFQFIFTNTTKIEYTHRGLPHCCKRYVLSFRHLASLRNINFKNQFPVPHVRSSEISTMS